MTATIMIYLQSFLITVLWLGFGGSCVVVVLLLLRKITAQGDPRHSRAVIEKRVAIKRMLLEVERGNIHHGAVKKQQPGQVAHNLEQNLHLQ